MRSSACIPTRATAIPSCASPRRWRAIAGRRMPRRSRPNELRATMDFALNDEQRDWQMKARKFAAEEIRPISLQRDKINDPRETFDWEIIKKGSKLGFRTMAVPKQWGGYGTDFVTQALVMAELAKADSAISKTFSQCWKWSHLIAATCTDEQKGRFLKPFLEDDTYLLGKGISEPSAGSDNRLPPGDDPKAGLKLRAERHGDEWILNGEKCFIANASVGKLFFIDARTNPNVPLREGTTMFLVPRDTPGFRIGKVFNKNGWRFYQNGEMIFENARVPHANAGRPDSVRPAGHPAEAEQNAHAHRGAALLRHAGGLGARSEDELRLR